LLGLISLRKSIKAIKFIYTKWTFSSPYIKIISFVQQPNRKRKQHSSSGPANSTGTGNTVGPSPNSPPSTHTPGDGIGTANSLQQVNNMPKGLMMYGAEGTGGLASSSNQLVWSFSHR